MTALLKLANVEIRYDCITAVRALSLEVNEGEVVALLGSNGAGKTTVLRCVSGLVRPSAGTVVFQGREITHESPDKIVRQGLVHVQEGRGILSRLTVLENLSMGAYIRRDSCGIKEDMEKAFRIFPVLMQRKNQLAGSLSGGEQQMLAIARALLASPKLIMMDEPSLGLAPIPVRELFAVIRDLKQNNITILLVEQNVKQALKVADRGYVLENGAVRIEGPANALLTDEIIVKTYLG